MQIVPHAHALNKTRFHCEKSGLDVVRSTPKYQLQNTAMLQKYCKTHVDSRRASLQDETLIQLMQNEKTRNML